MAAPLLTLLPLWAPLPLWADETPPPRVSFDLSSTLSHARNPDLLATGGQGLDSAALDFGLNLASDTRGQSFRLGLGGQLQSGGAGDAPTLNLSYTRESAHSAFQVKASHSDADVGAEDALTATGQVRDSDLSLGLQTGLEGPLGFDLSAQAQVKDYSETSDPSVYDQSSQSLDLGLSLARVAGGSLRLDLGKTRARFDDVLETARDSQSLTLSHERALDAATSLIASLGVTEAETRKLGLVFAASSGLTGSLALRREMGRGSVELGFQTERDAQGPRQSLQVAREMRLETATLSAQIGYSARPGESGQAVGRLAWDQELAASRLSLSFSRQVALNEDEADTLQTALAASWSRELGETGRLGLTYGLNAVGAAGREPVEAVTRQSLTASYSRDLARDWALSLGVTVTRLTRETDGAAGDERVFLTLARKFVLLP